MRLSFPLVLLDAPSSTLCRRCSLRCSKRCSAARHVHRVPMVCTSVLTCHATSTCRHADASADLHPPRTLRARRKRQEGPLKRAFFRRSLSRAPRLNHPRATAPSRQGQGVGVARGVEGVSVCGLIWFDGMPGRWAAGLARRVSGARRYVVSSRPLRLRSAVIYLLLYAITLLR